MEPLKIAPTQKFKIEIDGKIYEVARAKVKSQTALGAELRNVAGDDVKALEIIMKYMEELGLPKDFLENLDVDQFMQIVEYVNAAKKK